MDTCIICHIPSFGDYTYSNHYITTPRYTGIIRNYGRVSTGAYPYTDNWVPIVPPYEADVQSAAVR